MNQPEMTAEDIISLQQVKLIDQLKSDNAKLRKALVGLVDADGTKDLDMMEMHICDMTDADEPNRRVTLAAIKALRETLP